MELVKGFKKAKAEFDVEIIGGDTNESKELIIDCAMFGFAKGMVPRGGAKVGDKVFVSGKFGYTSSGLRILMEGLKAELKFKRIAIKSVLMPQPRLKLGIELAEKGLMNSSIDSSDGLAISLWEIAEKSHVGILLYRLPVGDGVTEFAKKNGLNWEELVLYGGEEYELVFTISEDKINEAKEVSKDLGLDIIEIGEVTEGEGVKYKKDDELIEIRKDGWVHLR